MTTPSISGPQTHWGYRDPWDEVPPPQMIRQDEPTQRYSCDWAPPPQPTCPPAAPPDLRTQPMAHCPQSPRQGPTLDLLCTYSSASHQASGHLVNRQLQSLEPSQRVTLPGAWAPPLLAGVNLKATAQWHMALPDTLAQQRGRHRCVLHHPAVPCVGPECTCTPLSPWHEARPGYRQVPREPREGAVRTLLSPL